MDDANGVGEVGNAKCGDIMKIYIKVENDVITDVKFNTFGCGSAIASSSMATELIKGKTIAEALELSNKAVVEALDGLPAHKLHCPSWLKRPSGLLSRTTTTATASPRQGEVCRKLRRLSRRCMSLRLKEHSKAAANRERIRTPLMSPVQVSISCRVPWADLTGPLAAAFYAKTKIFEYPVRCQLQSVVDQ